MSGEDYWYVGVRHFLYLCVTSFLRAGCRELRNPTQRAGPISLAGLVLAHSRRNRDFRRAQCNRRREKPHLSGAEDRCVVAFLRRCTSVCLEFFKVNREGRRGFLKNRWEPERTMAHARRRSLLDRSVGCAYY